MAKYILLSLHVCVDMLIYMYIEKDNSLFLVCFAVLLITLGFINFMVMPFCFFSSDESSWKRATELLVEVAGHGEDTGFEVPCLIVAAKDDLDSFPMAIQDSTRVFKFHLVTL